MYRITTLLATFAIIRKTDLGSKREGFGELTATYRSVSSTSMKQCVLDELSYVQTGPDERTSVK
jgi:hypothetical protein